MYVVLVTCVNFNELAFIIYHVLPKISFSKPLTHTFFAFCLVVLPWQIVIPFFWRDKIALEQNLSTECEIISLSVNAERTLSRGGEGITYGSCNNLVINFNLILMIPGIIFHRCYSMGKYFSRLWCNHNDVKFHESQIIHPKSLLLIHLFIHAFLHRQTSCTPQKIIFFRSEFCFLSRWSLIAFFELWVISLISGAHFKTLNVLAESRPKRIKMMAVKHSKNRQYLNIMQQQSNWFLINSTDKTEASAHKTQAKNNNLIIHT